MPVIQPLNDLETVNPGWRDKINQLIAWKNDNEGTTTPVGAAIPFFGNPNDPLLFDVSGVGVAGSAMERFALCHGQGLSGSLLKNFDGTTRSTAPNIANRFLYGYDPTAPALGSTGGTNTHKHAWSEKFVGGYRTWNVMGVIKNWLVDFPFAVGGAAGKTEPSTYAADFPDGKSYTDLGSSIPPYMVSAYIIRYK